MPKLSFLDWPHPTNFIRSKWEKRVVQYAEDHNDAYPGFKEFAAIIQEQARLKNHSKLMCWHVHNRNGELKTADHTFRTFMKRTPTQTEEFSNQVWQVETSQKGMPRKRNSVPCASVKDTLIECKAFKNKPLEAKNIASLKSATVLPLPVKRTPINRCTVVVKCIKCGDDHHATITTTITTCTSVCQNPNSGGVLCSKIVLVNVFTENGMQESYRVYAFIDVQSNASMISPNVQTN